MSAIEILPLVTRGATWCRQLFAFDGQKGGILGVFSTFNPNRCATRRRNQVNLTAFDRFQTRRGLAGVRVAPNRHAPRRSLPRTASRRRSLIACTRSRSRTPGPARTAPIGTPRPIAGSRCPRNPQYRPFPWGAYSRFTRRRNSADSLGTADARAPQRK